MPTYTFTSLNFKLNAKQKSEIAKMIEYGAVLPKSGEETKLFNSLSDKLKKKLLALDT